MAGPGPPQPAVHDPRGALILPDNDLFDTRVRLGRMNTPKALACASVHRAVFAIAVDQGYSQI
jgi:hypothetical protein